MEKQCCFSRWIVWTIDRSNYNVDMCNHESVGVLPQRKHFIEPSGRRWIVSLCFGCVFCLVILLVCCRLGQRDRQRNDAADGHGRLIPAHDVGQIVRSVHDIVALDNVALAPRVGVDDADAVLEHGGVGTLHVAVVCIIHIVKPCRDGGHIGIGCNDSGGKSLAKRRKIPADVTSEGIVAAIRSHPTVGACLPTNISAIKDVVRDSTTLCQRFDIDHISGDSGPDDIFCYGVEVAEVW
jgi:hypothetical protein